MSGCSLAVVVAAARRYAEMRAAGEEISRLVAANMQLLAMAGDQGSARWRSYVQFVDGLVGQAVLRAVGCSLAYLADNMDANMPPLFEAHLHLREPDIVFVPALDHSEDGFASLVQGLIADIVAMAGLIPRVAKRDHCACPSYQVKTSPVMPTHLQESPPKIAQSPTFQKLSPS